MENETSTNFKYVHCIYFKLSDRLPDTRRVFIQSCIDLLSPKSHQGMVNFFVGLRDVEMQRPVNDLDFDVMVTQHFASIDDYQRYRVHPDHEKWITKFGSLSSDRRVFDSYMCEESGRGK